MPASRERVAVEDRVGEMIQLCDPRQELHPGDFQDVLDTVSKKVLKVMKEDQRDDLDDDDEAFIARRVRSMVKECYDEYEKARNKPTRFLRAERVVCNVGGDRRWASGSVQAVNENDPADPTGQSMLPYVVKLDAPGARLISVPKDDYEVCRSEVCFGQRAGSLWFTLFCLPARRLKVPEKRFTVGERVAVAVEDETDDYSVWAAGTVTDLDYSVAAEASDLMPDRDWSSDKGLVPYRVELDSGCRVLVHKDEHWLVRDLALQAAGPRQLPLGTPGRTASSLTRIEKRHKGDYTFEAIDHTTRRVLPCEPPSDDEHGDDCPCGGH